MKKDFNKYLYTLLPIFFYVIYFYMVSKLLFNNDLIISSKDTTLNNISIEFISDFALMLLLPIILIIVYRKNLSELGLKKSKMSLILLILYICFFFLHDDFSVSGYYRAFYFIFIVGFPEELIFRGYLFTKLKSINRVHAIIISGAIWGCMHSILPGILNESSLSIILLSMLSEIGGGIIAGWFFIYLFEVSDSILVPIMVHSLLDYTYSFYGQLLALVIFSYFLFISKKQKQNPNKVYFK